MQFSFGIIDQTSPSTPSATPTPVWKILDSPLVVTWIYEFSILFAHFAMIIYSSIFHSFRKIAALYFSLSGFDWLIKPNLFYHGRSLIYWWLAQSPIWFTGLAYITKQVFTHKLPTTWIWLQRMQIALSDDSDPSQKQHISKFIHKLNKFSQREFSTLEQGCI